MEKEPLIYYKYKYRNARRTKKLYCLSTQVKQKE